MTATWKEIARKDFEDAVRSKTLWGLIVFFVAFLVMSLFTAEKLFPEAVTVDAPKALAGVGMLAQLFLPGIALVAGYMSVVGERRSGSLRVLLSYPFSRFDIVAGKLVGRTFVTGTALTVGFAVASVLVAVLYGFPEVTTFVGFVATGVLVGLTFTGLAVGGSAAVSTRGRAMALTVGSYMAMLLFWKPIAVGLYYVVNGSVPGLHADRWYFLLKRLNPLEAYRALTGTVLGERLTAVPRLPLEDVPANAPPGKLELSNRVVGEVPFYLQDWFLVVILIAWGLIPVVLGYRRFERSDLG
ncbi:MAG: ABC transporter permease subunit [Halobacteria archaeon]|nr:ABC transporter permease subunit [Halobacteria archaeon]